MMRSLLTIQSITVLAISGAGLTTNALYVFARVGDQPAHYGDGYYSTMFLIGLIGLAVRQKK